MNENHLITVDIEFDTLDHLNLSIEHIRIILDEFVTQNKVSNYYLMRYSSNFLGTKFISVNLEFKDEIILSIKNKAESILGFKGIRKIEQGSSLNQLSKEALLASIGMRARNEIYDVLKRKPSDEELLSFFHYLCNPLDMNYQEEASFCSYLIYRYLKENKIR